MTFITVSATCLPPTAAGVSAALVDTLTVAVCDWKSLLPFLSSAMVLREGVAAALAGAAGLAGAAALGAGLAAGLAGVGVLGSLFFESGPRTVMALSKKLVWRHCRTSSPKVAYTRAIAGREHSA